MEERLGYGGELYDDHQEYHAEETPEVSDENYEENHAEGTSEVYDENHEENHEQGFDGAVEHQADYAAEKGAESDLAATLFGPQSQARQAMREGTWLPMDTKSVRAPVFVPLDDLLLPWYPPGPSDKRRWLPASDAEMQRWIETIYDSL